MRGVDEMTKKWRHIGRNIMRHDWRINLDKLLVEITFHGKTSLDIGKAKAPKPLGSSTNVTI